MRLQLISLVLLLALGCVATGQSGEAPQAGAAPIPAEEAQGGLAAADSITIPLSEIDSTVRFYTFEADGATVRFFAVMGSDGGVRTAFDACEVCYRAGKGYSQSGSDVVCNNCGLRFKIDELGTKNRGSGCWPAYLPHQLEGDAIVIKKSDLEAGAYLFP
ncbi:MAG: DUF2318 domain-containing protein [Candidatus Micrarchaeota archaeon]